MAEIHAFKPDGTPSPGARTALETYRRGYSPREWGAVGDGVQDDTAAWNAMLNEVPAGAVVVCPEGDKYRLTGPVTLGKPVTLRGGEWHPSTTGSGLTVESSDVAIEGARITSDAATTNTTQRLIHALGTSNAPLDRVRIRDVTIAGGRYIAVALTWVRDFEITGCSISDVQYAGVMVLSGKGGIVSRNSVRDILRGDPFVNAYGIAITDVTNDEAGRSEDVTVDSNLVSDVPWEGIDTHGGRRIRFVNNTVERCSSGIAVLSGNQNRTVAVEDCLVANNTIAYGTGGAQGSSAIKFHGAQDDGRAQGSGLVVGNTITGFDRPVHVWNIDRSVSNVVGNNRAEVDWTPVPLRSPGWQAGPEPLEYMVDDNTITFRGAPNKDGNLTEGTTNTIGVLPEDYRPVRTRYLATTRAPSSDNIATYRYTDAGELQLAFETKPSTGGGYFPISAPVSLL